MTTNYNINNVDIDESPYNFYSYINANDGNYTNISALAITARKTVIFGQNIISSTIGNLGSVFDTQQVANILKLSLGA